MVAYPDRTAFFGDYFRVAGDSGARRKCRACTKLNERIGDLALVDAAHYIAKRKLAIIFPNCSLVPQGCHRIDAERASGRYQGSQNRNDSE
jgi:hypothetical protein